MDGPPCDQISLPSAGDCPSRLSPQIHPGRSKSSFLPAVHSALATEDDGVGGVRAGQVGWCTWISALLVLVLDSGKGGKSVVPIWH